MGRVRVDFAVCYDWVTIFDGTGHKRYKIASSFHGCMLCTYIYFYIKPLYKDSNGKKPKDDEGFGFWFEKLPIHYWENNLVDAIYMFFPPKSTYQERSLMIAAAVQMENSTFVASTQHNK